MIARAAIAAGPIAARWRRPRGLGADHVVPFAATGRAALDRRGLRPGPGPDEAIADDRDRVRRAVQRAPTMGAADAPPDAAARTGDRAIRAG